MAPSRFLIASLLLLLFAFYLAEPRTVSESEKVTRGGLGRSLLANTSINCGEACDGRCRLSSRPNLCKRACGTCCSRCNCVPPGTYGNYEACPCYAALTTHGGVRKCP
ncbi:gibberellin-regulated protein 1 isoform X1 [Elaeis guineensis]|uniref:Gibberellin-regulated protein 1 n=1 Tax=Elaeis guineensis var. tenera TaxID=51953 RepID=A0A6J0PQ73_ELAGV|nr:gibberellin-regulated protein 1 [Elaeis guineensis]